MTVSNITVLSAAVNAAFNLTIDGQRVKDIIANAAKPAEYEFGLFADQDIRACQSMYYTLIFQLVNLMRVDDTPLQDRAKEGSLDANDTGKPDENELAREEAIADVLYGIAYLQRHLRSLDERTRKELEEAGKRTADGGRVRFGLKNRVYKSMVKDVEEVLIDMKTREPASNTRRLAQIDMALDLRKKWDRPRFITGVAKNADYCGAPVKTTNFQSARTLFLKVFAQNSSPFFAVCVLRKACFTQASSMYILCLNIGRC